MSAPFERIAVVGLGLLGGSVALAARRRGVAQTVVGVSRRPETGQRARAAEVVDVACCDLAEGVRGAELVVLATPLEVTVRTLSAAAAALDEGVLVTDVGSVKGALAETLPGLLPAGASFVGAHPMAGGHHRGLDHARAELFEGSVCVLTPTPDTPPAALARVRAFWEGLGARVVLRDPNRHDREVAWVSHVPHGVAFAYAAALAGSPASARELEGPGFRDFTRIAHADPELWADILAANRKATVAPLREVAARLEAFARLLETGDAAAIERFIASAREVLAGGATDASTGGANPENSAATQGARGDRSDENHS